MDTLTIPRLLEPYKTSAIRAATGISANGVQRWRSGAKTPSVEHVRALAGLTGKPVETILEAIENTKKARAERVALGVSA